MIQIDKIQLDNAKEIYGQLKNRSLDPENDPIKQIHNSLDYISVYLDIKPAFYYGDDDVHPDAMEFIIQLSKKYNLLFELKPCLRNYDFLKSIKSVADEIMDIYIEYRRDIDGARTGLWIYKNPELMEKIDLASSGRLDYGLLLGYPDCCITENRDLLSKMHEFYLQYYMTIGKTQNPNLLIELMENPDLPKPDIHALNKPFYKIRLNRYPYISHTPCSVCLLEENNPTYLINEERKKLAQLLDESIDIFLSEFILYYNQANPG